MEEDWGGRYGFSPWYESFYSDLSVLRDGGFVGAMNDKLCSFGLELHSRATVGSAKVCWVVDIQHHDYLFPGFMTILDSKLRCVNAIQASLNDWLEGGRRTLVYSIWKSCVRHGWEVHPEEPSEPSEPSAIVVSAVVLLSLVYQYLTGNVDWGRSKAHSRSSLDFRDVYVSTVLFLGAYVWIKFREVAFKGVHPRKLVDKQGGIKIVYEARLTPPMWKGKKVSKLDLGQFATPQEAHIKFLIAAFYYNRAGGLLDGWFQVPPMSDEERRFTGKKKRKWVIGQAKKVYKEFKKEKAEAEADAAFVQELLEASKVQATPGHDEINVDFSLASLLNSAEQQQPALVSQATNSVMGTDMLDNHELECTSRSFDGAHEGLALANIYSLGCQEGFALPVTQLPPNAESGMSLNGSDQLGLLQTLVRTQQQQIYFLQQQSSGQQQQISLLQQQSSDQQQQISLLQQQSSDQQQQISLLQQQSSGQQQQISLLQRQIQEFVAQLLQSQNQQGIQQQQQFQESWIPDPQWPYLFCLQQQQLQVLNQGVPSFEVWMEQSMHEQNYPGLTTLPPDGGEAQEGF